MALAGKSDEALPNETNMEPFSFENFHNDEHDACGIVACLEKNKQPTRQNIFDCINALVR